MTQAPTQALARAPNHTATPAPVSRLVTNLSKALWDSDLICSRLTLAMAEFFWAVMLLWWGSSHDLFARPTYKYMDAVMPAEAWGLLLLLSAGIQVGILLQDDLHSRFARYFAAINAVTWMYIGVVSPLLSVYPPPAAMGGEFALSVTAFWIWVRPYILARGHTK